MSKGSFRTAVLGANGVTLLIASLVAFKLQGTTGLVAAVVGDLAGLLNLAALGWLMSRLLGAASAGSKSAYGALLATKLGLFLGLLAILLWVLELPPLGVMLGFTALVVALVAGSAIHTLNLRSPTTEESSPL